MAEAAVHSHTVVTCRQQGEAAEDSPVEDPSMKSFLGKIKAFEKLDHFARAQRILEVQEAQNARVGIFPLVICSVVRSFTHNRSQGLQSVLRDF